MHDAWLGCCSGMQRCSQGLSTRMHFTCSPSPLLPPPLSHTQVRRVYFVMHHVLKELSSKRLAADQKNFAEVRCGARCRRCLLPLRAGEDLI